MYIAIRKEPNGEVYIDKSFFLRYTDNDLVTHNYKKVLVPDEYFPQITYEDFNNETLEFDAEKFVARIDRELELGEIPTLRKRLEDLSEDIVQMQCGAVFEDKDDRIAEFQQIHNEIRRILNKESRIYLTSNQETL